MRTKIEWTDTTWNPVRGCSRVSDGCRNCYAQRTAARFDYDGGPYDGLTKGGGACRCTRPGAFDQAGRCSECGGTFDGDINWTGEVRFIPEKLDQPLRWRKPRRVFVNSMSDLFHEKLSDEQIAAVFGVMAACPQHSFQVLTKRPGRMREWFRWMSNLTPCDLIVQRKAITAGAKIPLHRVKGTILCRPWPLPNVHLGVSIEDQETADERIPILLDTPAAVRWVSAEPLLAGVDLRWCEWCGRFGAHDCEASPEVGLDWLVVGGESGPSARPCNVEWIRSLVRQCREAGVPAFVKQVGSKPSRYVENPNCTALDTGELRPCANLRSRAGSDPSEWPEDLRVREFPQERANG